MTMSSSDTSRPPQSLGRGLSALFQDEGEDYASLDQVRQAKSVPVEFLTPGPFQPRRHFDAADLESLVESVRERGILQPILVRRSAENASMYEIVAGERRWRAAQLAQLHEVPVLIRELSNEDTLEIALVENIQRADLTALEEAQGYRRLIDEFSYSTQHLAKAIGKSRSHIANMMRLLELPPAVQEMIDGGALTAGHARALVGAKDALELARTVVKRGLNVRQTEALTRPRKAPRIPREASFKDADTAALERDLGQRLGLKVTIAFQGRSGTLSIHYSTLEQLDDILRRLDHPTSASAKDTP